MNKFYTTPSIEVIEIEIENDVMLQNSDFTNGGVFGDPTDPTATVNINGLPELF